MGDKDSIYIPLNKRLPEEQPRERLSRYGVHQLRTSELIALILRTGSARQSAVDLSDQLLRNYNDDLHRISRLELNELKSNPGFGTASGCALIAAFELGRRARHVNQPEHASNLKCISDVAQFFRQAYGAGAPEKFAAFFINRRYRLLGHKLIAQGGFSATAVDPRIVFKEALLLNASAVLLAHNHPGGSLDPSRPDIDLTRQLVDAGHLFRIPVAEHVIVTEESEKGILQEAAS